MGSSRWMSVFIPGCVREHGRTGGRKHSRTRHQQVSPSGRRCAGRARCSGTRATRSRSGAGATSAASSTSSTRACRISLGRGSRSRIGTCRGRAGGRRLFCTTRVGFVKTGALERDTHGGEHLFYRAQHAVARVRGLGECVVLECLANLNGFTRVDEAVHIGRHRATESTMRQCPCALP